MKKIPTLFQRDPDDRRHVLPLVTPGCEWVLAGEGVATRKYDGTCVMFDGARWWARREVKDGKVAPDNFLLVSVDNVTGKRMGWEPIEQSGFAKWHAEAVAYCAANDCADFKAETFELCGPKINGNPEGWAEHDLMPHRQAEQIADPDPCDYDTLSLMFSDLAAAGWEGIVWHHPDRRMAKLKVRDFPRPASRDEGATQ